MRSGFLIRFISLVCVSTLLMFVLVSCSNGGSNTDSASDSDHEAYYDPDEYSLAQFTDEDIAYKEVYYFQTKNQNGKSVDYTVKNSKGESVSIYNYTFVVSETTPYKVKVSCGKNTKEYTLTPKDLTAPLLYVKNDVRRVNVLDGQKTHFPEIVVSDNVDANVSVSYSVKHDGNNYDISGNGFTPNGLGFYELSITAKDSAGNVSKKKVVYESVATIEETYKVFAFDEDALRYVDYVGITALSSVSYNTDKNFTYGEEQGSTRICGVAAETPVFMLKNQLIDTSEFDKIVFYVYNAGDLALGFGMNITTRTYSLKPGEWTEIVIDSWTARHSPTLDHSDITGMPFMFFKGVQSITERFGYNVDIYLSAAYGVTDSVEG